MAKAFATFLRIENAARGVPEYRIRFNNTAAKLLAGAVQVRISKTANYIIVTPTTNGCGMHLSYDKDGCPSITMSRLVKHEGFLHKDLFDGSRFAVKRGKSVENRAYICLQEKVGDDG